MKFSILMPTKGRPGFLLSAIGAIVRQTYQNWELLISTEDYEADYLSKIQEIDRRIFIVERPRGQAAADALNHLARLSTGTVLNFSADDDRMVPGALEYVSDHAVNIENSWAYGQIDVNGQSQGGWYGDEHRLSESNVVPCPAVFWGRDIGLTVGEFDATIGPAFDYDYWLRLASISNASFLPQVLSIYGVHPGQISQVSHEVVSESADLVRQKFRRRLDANLLPQSRA